MQYYLCMHKNKGLNQIAEIITGYTFRGPIHEEPGSSLSVLQAKNIREDILIDDVELTKTSVDTSHTKAFVQNDDIVIGSRGIFKAGIVRSNKQILAASSVYLLRIKDKSVALPGYLAIYLNSVAGQKNLYPCLTTGTIRTLLKRDLENIQIPLPSIDRQKQIIQLDDNIRGQARLLSRKILAQKNIINGILKQLERSSS